MDGIKKFEPLWGVWHCECVLGEGSFGRVYKAVRREDGHDYYAAIKHISVPANAQQLNEARSSGLFNTEEELGAYFNDIAHDVKHEIDLMYRLKANTNIVSYEDHLVIPKPDGIGYDIFIRMELLRDLSSIIAEKAYPVDVAKVGIDICAALEVCVRSNIIHRDIKPSNIFMNENGDFKLGDFGIARVLSGATAGVSKKGTYTYMAPEIYRCEPANFTSDIYSLGIVLYKMLNENRLPFMPLTGRVTVQDQENALIKAVSGAPMPPPANATPQMASVILKACAFDRRQRFQRPEEFAKALKAAAEGTYYPGSDHYQQTVIEGGFAPAYGMPMQQPAPMPMPMQQPVQPVQQKKKNGKKTGIILGILGALIAILGIGFAYVYMNIIVPNDKYSKAEALMKAGQYEEAKEAFLEIADFEDSDQMVIKCENHMKYEEAVDLMENGDYEEAIKIFESLGTFGDSSQMVLRTTYRQAEAYMDYGYYDEAAELFISLGDFEDSADMAKKAGIWKIKDAKTRSIVEFGSYEQDNNTSNGPEPIRWIVLSNNSSGVFLVSEQTLDCVKYHNESRKEITWEKCSLRTWLNNDFYNAAFSEYEKDFVGNTTVYGDTNSKYGTTGGATTTDKVFILSLSEIETYFPTDADKRCIPTRYAVERGVHTSSNYAGAGWWWARTPGYDRVEAVWIRVSGEPAMASHVVSKGNHGIRPAIWLEFD